LISLKRFFQARVLLAVWWAWPLLASAEVSATAPRSQRLANPQKQQVRGFLLVEPHRAKLFKKEQVLKKTPDVIDCLVQCLVDAPNSFFIFTDHLGTPFAWVKVSTGEITYTPYSPWGELLAHDPTRGPPAFPEGNIPASGIPLPEFSGFPGNLPPLGLAGHLIEQDTGLVVMHHRTYHPRLGHFLTPDFRAPDIDDPSTFTEPYAYAAGNPGMYWDEDGLQTRSTGDGYRAIEFEVGGQLFEISVAEVDWQKVMSGSGYWGDFRFWGKAKSNKEVFERSEKLQHVIIQQFLGEAGLPCLPYTVTEELGKHIEGDAVIALGSAILAPIIIAGSTTAIPVALLQAAGISFGLAGGTVLPVVYLSDKYQGKNEFPKAVDALLLAAEVKGFQIGGHAFGEGLAVFSGTGINSLSSDDLLVFGSWDDLPTQIPYPIANTTPVASKTGAITDPARLLPSRAGGGYQTKVVNGRTYELRPSNGGTGPNRWHRVRSASGAQGRDPFHHIFPQRADLAERFAQAGVGVDEFTMQLPRDIHQMIHRGGPRGGAWNKAWEDFFAQPGDVTAEDIYRKAGELIYQFQIPGTPVVPYP
jgi:uncharacterized lipoprotein (TIGR02269 family)